MIVNLAGYGETVKSFVKYCINNYSMINLRCEINHKQTYTPLFEREHFSHPLCVITEEKLLSERKKLFFVYQLVSAKKNCSQE
ncbi:hypothetical protein B0X71_12935 [Planococcus lenghuensis]|uniref:Uncharacterized protein n=1 Tax=Planococcus lenghuensis TaxID=2213202 RepID=A0A1Q2L1I4_9BACL|nr:hypothetical protein B0X71_12935 [Planococcus lenghuensis]